MRFRNCFVAILAGGLTIFATTACAGAHARKTNVNGIGWYASLPDALDEAKRTGKPILFLSMFGRLDEAMPCANARTLRATLFKDPEFKKFATTEAVPAWEMVRAVPKIQIDFGDGKKIERTVRGNAVMYLLNSDGKVIDAFPGVYAAHAFLPEIRASIENLTNVSAAAVIAYHKARGKMIRPSLTSLGKTVVESPTLDMIGAAPFAGAPSTLKADTPEQALFLQAAKQITDLSLRPMQVDDVVLAVTGKPMEGRKPEEIANEILENDSLTNMTRVRPVIHLWLAAQKELPTPEQARDAVLGTILKIPYKDPYFGLRDVAMPGTPR